MDRKELFDPILDKDEEILKIYEPNKVRAWFNVILYSLFTFLFLSFITIGLYVDEETGAYSWLVPLTLIVIIFVVYMILMKLWCKNTVYCITNKRVLIRTGFIGVDFKSLNYDMLGAMTVNVSWVDKLLRKNTGTISFGSMSSPLTNQGGAKFVFSYIHDPYVVYKEIKEIIDNSKVK